MTRRTVGLALLYLVPLYLYSRQVVQSLEARAVEAGLALSFWDAVLAVLRHPHSLVYWVLPTALWVMVARVTRHHHPEHLIRHPSRTSWVVARMVDGITGGAALLTGMGLVAVAVAVRYPFQWRWSVASASGGLTQTYAEILPTASVPAVAAAVQLGAAVLTVATATGVIATVCVLTGGRVGWVAMTTVALVVWGIVSFRFEGAVTGAVGMASYLVTTQAEATLPWGAASALVLLPAATGTCVVTGALAERLRIVGRLHPRRQVWLAAVLLGSFALAGLHAAPMATSPAEFFAMVHAGPSPEGLSYVPFLSWAILTLGPALMLHSGVAERIEYTMHQELIRAGSPTRWWWPVAARSAVIALLYAGALALATVAVAAVVAGGGPHPSGEMLAFFVVAMALQITVYTALMFVAAWVSGTPTAAAAVLGGCVLAALPPVLALGVLPSGLSGVGGPDTPASDWTRLLVLGGWLVAVLLTTALALRGRFGPDR